MDVVLAAIAEPNRRAILQLVSQNEMAAGEIAAQST
jgi:DNA-binding transcriptional ArsR family regulator